MSVLLKLCSLLSRVLPGPVLRGIVRLTRSAVQTFSKRKSLPASDPVPVISREMRPYYQTARPIYWIVVHCTASRPSLDYTKDLLWRDHVVANGWDDIGYHIYIRRSGEVIDCRPVVKAGAHCKGYNAHSIGVAWEGGVDEDLNPCDNRTDAQKERLLAIIADLMVTYPEAVLIGHHELNPHKACPCFDVQAEYCELIESRDHG